MQEQICEIVVMQTCCIDMRADARASSLMRPSMHAIVAYAVSNSVWMPQYCMVKMANGAPKRRIAMYAACGAGSDSHCVLTMTYAGNPTVFHAHK